jgi:cytidylate kinase
VVIAIDGPGGVGKSTVARAVAERLGAAHLDTGAYYRAATLAVLRAGVDPSEPAAVAPVVADARIGYEAGRVALDERDVTDDVRSDEVTATVSTVSAIADVRTAIVAAQRRWVSEHGEPAVVEGRDIGTVVFPDAALKVYLTADARTRAQRRAGDAEAEGIDIEELTRRLIERDRADSSRATSPLRPADDAVIVDTTVLTVEQVVTVVLGLAGALGA